MFCTNLIPKHSGGCVEQIKAEGKHVQLVFTNTIFTYIKEHV